MPHGVRAEMTPKHSQPAGPAASASKVSDYYGCNVFGLETMKLLLPKETYRRVQDAVERGETLDIEAANAVASAMKTWAMQKGATHYCHWFQPLTGATAEKHDAFIDLAGQGAVIETFTGQMLAQAEPDASSFPSGGLRVTFEARGYTAWDPTSPAFILENPGGATLCIPTCFVSYTGHALDTKTPLLRSIEVLNAAALSVLELFKSDARKVFSTLGAEQEYFLVDQEYFQARPDLLLAGRTLFGAASPKGQQLEDHYFGSIKDRVFAFMTDFEREAFKLGIPLKTRHNEVAPHQFECAPIFEEANVAVDHNQLVMDLLERIAARHGLAALLYEKPFAGVNGSGKHNNWSLGTDTGKNLLSPGATPQENLQFLTILTAIVKAVHDHSLLLRASIASSGNDHRLGANEAPPAIMSVFLGAQLTKVLDDLEAGVTTKGTDPMWISFGIDKIPPVLKDNTDRNRTSPFAFTGNKFEFRAVGSSANSAVPIATLNTIVANQLRETRKEISAAMKGGKAFKEAVLEVLRGQYRQSKAVCFEGNNYSEEWVRQAKKRGLPNEKTTPAALKGFSLKKSVELFAGLGVLTEEESRSRCHVLLEKYAKDISIEAKLVAEMTTTLFVPAAVDYQNRLAAAVAANKAAGIKAPAQAALLRDVIGHIEGALAGVQSLGESLAEAEGLEEASARAEAFCAEVKPWFEKIRAHVDALELLMPAAAWPVPKYREMLFLM
ncbi:MAG TPA: glutamine synthetase type III [Elusimicrobia bacterium]|nr:MAG: glutamine synthetase [Elusimicrobia bacterium GWA2_66_18]OGR69758.1 MAG: glutamine synthetase [Elusimicrobia bacterium GWC2_65_9]HAZ06955.1 glutamine synthetase type III [Elusimicrobiota bacterium]